MEGCTLEWQRMKRITSIFRTPDGQVHAGTFLLVCGIFVCTGLCNGMIDSLNKHFQNSFQVSKAASAFVQFFWYFAYFLLALPSGWFARRFGYRAGIVTGLTLVMLGSLIVYVRRVSGDPVPDRLRPDAAGNHRQSLRDRARTARAWRGPHQLRPVL
jgi:hypothetical protein